MIDFLFESMQYRNKSTLDKSTQIRNVFSTCSHLASVGTKSHGTRIFFFYIFWSLGGRVIHGMLWLIDFSTSGHEADVKHWCPVLLLSNFTYSHNDGSVTTCGASNSDLAVCPSWTTMTFNYASCSTVQGFSGRCLFCNKSSLILNT